MISKKKRRDKKKSTLMKENNNTMTIEERIRAYLGGACHHPEVVDMSTLDENNRPVIYCYEDFCRDTSEISESRTTYFHDMTRYLYPLTSLHRFRFLFYPRDRVEPFPIPTLVKSRPIRDHGKSILMNLNVERHFSDISERLVRADIPTLEKKPVLLWRGGDTGYGFGNNIPFRPVSREMLVRKYAQDSDPRLDIGLSGTNRPEFQKYCRKKMTFEEQLQYRFILSVEGNDVATNLKWLLYSNSVPFCPPFEMESWILESRLKPWVHYIPVRYDFTDLVDKVEWAVRHPQECEFIVINGREYIRQFLHVREERLIIDAILEKYASSVSIIM